MTVTLPQMASQLTPTASTLRLCVVSNGTVDGVGGLASYMRGLLDHLAVDNSVSAVGRFTTLAHRYTDYAAAETPRVLDHGAYQTQVIAPQRVYRPLLRHLSHLVSRPPLDNLAIATVKAAYAPAMRAAIPAVANVVHFVGTGWELIGFAALAEARRRGAAFTVLPAVHPREWGDSPLDVRFYNQADAVFVLSHFEREHLERLGVNPARLVVQGLAPTTQGTGDGARFRSRHDLGDRPIILFVGRKDRGKGYHALREAMAEIVRAVPETCLVVIGPDIEPPYPDVPKGVVLDLGRASEEDKEDALAACDVFCLPSKGESFGIVFAEAWSYGKPVIGGPAPALRELIRDSETGYCVGQEPQEIAAALLPLLADPARARELGAAGRRLQQNLYTWEKVTEGHKDVFQRV